VTVGAVGENFSVFAVAMTILAATDAFRPIQPDVDKTSHALSRTAWNSTWSKCAILAWHAVMAALKGDQKPVTTESEEI
jgi:hypothetical protein